MAEVLQRIGANLIFLLLGTMVFSAEPPHPALIPGLANHSTIKPSLAGNILLSELNCTACHASESGGIPLRGAPDLARAGDRIRPEHMRRFILDPSQMKEGTVMPNVLGHLSEEDRRRTALAITHYLMSLSTERLSIDPVQGEAVERGRELYHSVGCVACHSPEETIEGSVPLGALEQKYSLASLAGFIEDPLAVRPGGRMPDLALDHWEAVDIASYLLRKGPPPSKAWRVNKALAKEGEGAFVRYGCVACHALDGLEKPPAQKRLNDLRLSEGCLSEQPGPWPKYPLDSSQKQAIQATLAKGEHALSLSDQLELELTRLNCIACHRRGEYGGFAESRDPYFKSNDPNLGEQGRLPPALTGVGAKLKRDWLGKVLISGASVRPYLKTRMPRFGEANVAGLVDLFKQADQLPPSGFKRVTDEREAHKIGHSLIGDRGLNCVACHTFRGRSAASLRAADLATAYERLEENWFHLFLMNPPRFQPLTIMPTFWPGGQSVLTEVLGGNAEMQINAIWQHLARGPDAPNPSGLVFDPLQLEVKEEAVMLRRSYPGIGKRGIGVGYPAGVNLSFDAGQVRLASVWHGEFIEASSVWRGQGSGSVRILGRDVVRFPEGPAFAVLSSLETPWPASEGKRAEGLQFKGYDLDQLRRPTFRYTFRKMLVEDRMLDRRDEKDGGYFERVLSFPAGLPANSHFRVAEDQRIEKIEERVYAIGKSLKVKLSSKAIVRDAGEGQELIVPLRDQRALTIEYHW